MLSFITIELLGFLAGTLCTGSTLPQIIANIKRPAVTEAASVVRNVLLASGNFLWVVYGLINRLAAVPIFCGIATALLVVLLIQQLRTRR
jgi:uncharacterized protein with PQ loop repeat